VANDYAILSTPVMFLVDSKNNLIMALPDTLEQLVKELEK
jgi:thioredoxin-related protein